ncbi:MAG: Crp/Fnr family transcriptional regulator [Bacteroidetes bacterium]|nr:Crp/Fnr family transcriptional regulator [Bacteroidota bacterium]
MFSDSVNTKNRCSDCKDKSCAAAILTKSQLDQINFNSRESEVQKGEIILHQGSLTSHIIYLKSGLVKEFVKPANDREQILSIVKEHTYLGLPSLFGDRINHYSYSALEDIKVCYIDINVFNKLIKENGGFAYEILVSVSRDSLNNFHRFVNQSQKRIYGRVADAILYFARIIYETNAFNLPFTRKEFADLIGVSRESGTRALIKFKEEGIIDINGRFLKIKKMELLEQISKKG